MLDLILSVPDHEDQNTVELLQKCLEIKDAGFFKKEQLLKILNWKSPRPIKFYNSNSEKEIREITRYAFVSKNENLKIHILTALKGVNYPAASAILMFHDKRKYPVLDIRVWRQLYKAKLVDANPKGRNFTLGQWETYLKVIRELAAGAKLTARQVEKRLFDYDTRTQIGKLYI